MGRTMVVVWVAFLLGCPDSHPVADGGRDAASVETRDTPLDPPRVDAGPECLAGVRACPLGFSCEPTGDTFHCVERADAGVETPILTSLLGPADYGCLGAATAPSAGPAIDYSVELYSFGAGDPVRAVGVRLFADDTPTVDCGPSCRDYTTSSLGAFPVTGPASRWIAYRSSARVGATMATTMVETLAVHVAAPSTPGIVLQARAVSLATLNLVPAAFGVKRVAGSPLLLGEVRDCRGEPIRGATVRLFAASGSEVIPGETLESPRIQYFDGMTNPDEAASHTAEDGLYAGFNLEAPGIGGGSLRAEAWGVLTRGGPLTRIGCEQIELIADGASLLTLGPTRTDYPVDHPCR